jgi:hypothetical protein
MLVGKDAGKVRADDNLNACGLKSRNYHNVLKNSGERSVATFKRVRSNVVIHPRFHFSSGLTRLPVASHELPRAPDSGFRQILNPPQFSYAVG